jgi:uncharacterized protein with GYD domain
VKRAPPVPRSSHRASDQEIKNVRETVGPCDIVAILEAPDDASAFVLEFGSAGNVQTTTLRAYDSEEMSGILERLGCLRERLVRILRGSGFFVVLI